ncbi:MAG: aldo/keto reductase [Cyclobacteriaceae bacterium]|nr:aldo/keto reductase [Cyclobacteriaceae bacterium]
MNYRRFGRTGWKVSDIGYGMWGMGGWSESDDAQSDKSLDLAVELGCNFFDTAHDYGDGRSERILGRLTKRHPNKKLYIASKIPPLNKTWPSRPEFKAKDVFPAKHIIEYTEKSLKNLGVETIDLMQFHVWEDGWADVDEWKEAVEMLKKQGKIQHMGVSVNRWEPDNCLNTLKTGFIDSVQVIYNIFDQAPEDNLFPLCNELDIAIIARVPFDEGTLTGTLTKDTKWPEGDWRNTYFVPENLNSSVDHAEELKKVLPEGMTMPEMALKFILQNDQVSTIIPGMRKENHVKSNIAVSDNATLSKELMETLREHRWDRQPTSWSQ